MHEVPLDFLERLLATIVPDEWNTFINLVKSWHRP